MYMKSNLYQAFNMIVILVSIVGLQLIWTMPLSAQAKELITPDQMSANLISWLKTGMSVVFILTLLFGVHNMWLHNKFTGFKEQTVAIIKAEFQPRFDMIENNMAKREALEQWKQLQEQILLRIQEGVAVGNRLTEESLRKLEDAKYELENFREQYKNNDNARS